MLHSNVHLIGIRGTIVGIQTRWIESVPEKELVDLRTGGYRGCLVRLLQCYYVASDRSDRGAAYRTYNV